MKPISIIASVLLFSFQLNPFASDCDGNRSHQANGGDTSLVAMNISKDAIHKPVEQRLQWAKEAGFTAQHEVTLKNVSNVVPVYDKQGIHLAAVYELIDLESDDDLSWIEQEFKSLEEHQPLIFLGIKGGSPSSVALDSEAVYLIRYYANTAAKHGLRIVVYPHAYYYAERFEDALRLSQQVDRPNVGVIFNLCHFLMVQGDEDWKTALESAGEKLWAVSLNGANVRGDDWSELIQPLDRGSFDTTEFLQYLDSLQFQGIIALQDYGVKGNPRETLERSLRAFREIRKKINTATTADLKDSK